MTRLLSHAIAGSFVVSAAFADAGKPPPGYPGTCTDAGCHHSFTERRVIHDPVGEGECDVCHTVADEKEHRFKLNAEGAELCTDCHDAPSGKVEHDPVAQGECTACHDPHGSAGRHLLTGRTVGEVCTGCHDGVVDDHKYVHGPAAVGACTACHEAHAADHPALLRAPEQEVCLKCHQPLAERLQGKSYTHAPVSKGCIACHNPHGADDKLMLKQPAPGLCFSCHPAISAAATSGTVNHAPITEGSACALCHDAHASDFESVLKQEPITVCLSCHDKTIETKTGKLGDFKSLLANNPEHHGPIAEGNCTGCHGEVHGGTHFRLLNSDYPAKFYASYDEDLYALCFECHEADAMRDKRTDAATDFRNGDENLHYVHVNREGKGRTCRACHQTHASKWPKHVTESVPFGDWDLPLNFEKTPTGGSCLPGCHRLYRYDRKSSVVNVPRT
ncbi:MAG: cytochrome C [bacterium]|nr:cytochrome C [bacterium]